MYCALSRSLRVSYRRMGASFREIRASKDWMGPVARARVTSESFCFAALFSCSRSASLSIDCKRRISFFLSASFIFASSERRCSPAHAGMHNGRGFGPALPLSVVAVAVEG